MSPILVRPVREQLEHDRVIRLLHAKSRRRYDAGMNPGIERNAAVGTGSAAVYPDLVLLSQERGKRLEAVVEVETSESVNHLEALAEWAHYARLRAAFHLYVPSQMVEVAKQLCEDNHIAVTEIWSYHSIGEDVRFTQIFKSKDAPVLAPLKPEPAVAAKKTAPVKAAAAAPPARKPARKSAARPNGKAAKPAAKKAATKSTAKAATAKRPAARPASRSAKPKPAAPPRRKAATAKKVAARPQKRK